MALGSWLVCFKLFPSRGGADGHGLGLALGFSTDGPDESEKLAANSCHDVRPRFSFRQEPTVATVQSMLGLPGDRLDLLGKELVSLSKLR